jgi:hypothetical protein
MATRVNRWVLVSGLVVIALAGAYAAPPEPLQAVYDLDWSIRYYLRENIMYSLDWQIEYYIRDDSVFDRGWIKRYYLRENALYDWNWQRRYYIREYTIAEKPGK